jgi:hypothetical protein
LTTISDSLRDSVALASTSFSTSSLFVISPPLRSKMSDTGASRTARAVA